jgi:hypothetical protein
MDQKILPECNIIRFESDKKIIMIRTIETPNHDSQSLESQSSC